MGGSLNLFWREPILPKPGRMEEKENNVTHAFLATLANDRAVTAALLQEILSKSSLRNAASALGRSPEFDFQVSESRKAELRTKQVQIILFIDSEYDESLVADTAFHPIPEAGPQNRDSGTGRDRPDGLILGKNAAVLIESKIRKCNPQAREEQIGRYNRVFFGGAASKVYLTWQQLYRWLSRRNSKETITKHFLKYLEAINLSGFRGIPFFDKKNEWNDAEAEAVAKELSAELKKWFDTENVGLSMNIRPKGKKAGLWDYFYYPALAEKAKKSGPQSIPHMAVYMNSNHFGISVTFNKKAVIKKILGSEKRYSEFFEKVKGLSKNPDAYLALNHYKMLAHKREYKHNRQGPKYEDFKLEYQLSRLKNNPAEEDFFKSLMKLSLRIPLKEIALLEKFYYEDSSDNKVFCDGESALKKIKSVITGLKPNYEFIAGLI